MVWLIEQLSLGFLPGHCAEARTMLGWSVEALAFRSGVSPGAIRCIENWAELRCVTIQPLASAMQAEGLVFFQATPARKQLPRGHTTPQYQR